MNHDLNSQCEGTTGNVCLFTGDTVRIRIAQDGSLFLTGANLPAADPKHVGQLWNDGGTLKVSSGPATVLDICKPGNN